MAALYLFILWQTFTYLYYGSSLSVHIMAHLYILILWQLSNYLNSGKPIITHIMAPVYLITVLHTPSYSYYGSNTPSHSMAQAHLKYRCNLTIHKVAHLQLLTLWQTSNYSTSRPSFIDVHCPLYSQTSKRMI